MPSDEKVSTARFGDERAASDLPAGSLKILAAEGFRIFFWTPSDMGHMPILFIGISNSMGSFSSSSCFEG